MPIKIPDPWPWINNCLEQCYGRFFRLCELYIRNKSVQRRWALLTRQNTIAPMRRDMSRQIVNTLISSTLFFRSWAMMHMLLKPKVTLPLLTAPVYRTLTFIKMQSAARVSYTRVHWAIQVREDVCRTSHQKNSCSCMPRARIELRLTSCRADMVKRLLVAQI